MITRRNFLKLSGISAAALGAGYSTGKIMSGGKGFRFSITGFIPADEELLARLILLFRKKVRSSSGAEIFSDNWLRDSVKQYDEAAVGSDYRRSGRIYYKLKRIEQPCKSDIIISDSRISLYTPDDDFSFPFLQLRHDMRERTASYIFNAEYKEESLMSRIFKPAKNIIIENEKGIAEIINPGRNFKEIAVNGPLGKTHTALSDGIVRVTKSCCRNKICEHTLLSGSQGIIACAPNKIIIHLES